MTTGMTLVRKDRCFMWAHKKNATGYGQLRYRGKVFYSHRIIWTGLNGPIPKGLCVLHKCDTPSCFNPAHLFLGTIAENNRDRDSKGRNASKLTAVQVREIRELHAMNDVNQTELGKQYGVSGTQIGLIISGRNWRNV